MSGKHRYCVGFPKRLLEGSCFGEEACFHFPFFFLPSCCLGLKYDVWLSRSHLGPRGEMSYLRILEKRKKKKERRKREGRRVGERKEGRREWRREGRAKSLKTSQSCYANPGYSIIRLVLSERKKKQISSCLRHIILAFLLHVVRPDVNWYRSAIRKLTVRREDRCATNW